VLMLTRKVFDISRGLIERPSIAFMPAVSHLAGSGDMKKMKVVLSRLMRMQTWLLMLVTAELACFNNDFVSLWVGGDLFAGKVVNMILCIGLIMSIIVSSFSSLSMALGSIKRNSLALVIQSAILIGSLYFGVRYFGLAGAVLAPVLAMGMVGVWFYPKLLYGLINFSPDDKKEMAKEFFAAFFIACFLSAIFIQFEISSWVSLIAFSFLLVLIYLSMLWVFSLFFRSEAMTLKSKVSLIVKRSSS